MRVGLRSATFLVAVGTAAVGCATAPGASQELVAAQQALREAQAMGATHSVAEATQAARTALLAAERCEQSRGAAACADASYLALRRAQLAQTLAQLLRARDSERAARTAHSTLH